MSYRAMAAVARSAARAGSVRRVAVRSFASAPAIPPGAAVRKTVDEAEIRKFSEQAKYWWRDEIGPFSGLHRMNAVRIPMVKRALLDRGAIDTRQRPLEGLTILDVGCGGGILSEPLARLGAHVTGVDAAEANIIAAKAHAATDASLASNLRYECTTAEALVAAGRSFDCVVCSEVMEHVGDVASFTDALCSLMKPDGRLVITTINRTALAFLGAILAAEYILRIVPAGTHEWAKFVRPEDLSLRLQQRGVVPVETTGLFFEPLTQSWSFIGDTSVNYGLIARKLPGADGAAAAAAAGATASAPLQ